MQGTACDDRFCDVLKRQGSWPAGRACSEHWWSVKGEELHDTCAGEFIKLMECYLPPTEALTCKKQIIMQTVVIHAWPKPSHSVHNPHMLVTSAWHSCLCRPLELPWSLGQAKRPAGTSTSACTAGLCCSTVLDSLTCC